MAANPLAKSDLQFAVRKILKQHQRECEDAGDFGKAREAQAALQELQYRCELEGLCRLFCRHYRQLSDADAAYEKQIHTLQMQWQTVQLPELVERIRKWRTQLQGRQRAELSSIATQETEDENKTKPRFRREAFELQRKMQYLGASRIAAKRKVSGHGCSSTCIPSIARQRQLPGTGYDRKSPFHRKLHHGIWYLDSGRVVGGVGVSKKSRSAGSLFMRMAKVGQPCPRSCADVRDTSPPAPRPRREFRGHCASGPFTGPGCPGA